MRIFKGDKLCFPTSLFLLSLGGVKMQKFPSRWIILKLEKLFSFELRWKLSQERWRRTKKNCRNFGWAICLRRLSEWLVEKLHRRFYLQLSHELQAKHGIPERKTQNFRRNLRLTHSVSAKDYFESGLWCEEVFLWKLSLVLGGFIAVTGVLVFFTRMACCQHDFDELISTSGFSDYVHCSGGVNTSSLSPS